MHRVSVALGERLTVDRRAECHRPDCVDHLEARNVEVDARLLVELRDGLQNREPRRGDAVCACDERPRCP